MSELPETRGLLEAAEQAAAAGDLVSADELLRSAVRVQEGTLGPMHPDLVSTLNNLAIVSERSRRPQDAEALYRRAARIAAATLPADHPAVAVSRENLEDFCRAWGVPLEAPVMTSSGSSCTESELDAFPPEETSTPAAGQANDDEPPLALAAAQPRPATERSVAGAPASASSQTTPSVRRLPRASTWAALVVVVLLTALFAATRRWLPREPAAAIAPAVSVVQPASAPDRAASADSRAAAAPIVPEPPEPVRRTDADEVSATTRAGRPEVSGSIVLAAAELCRAFSITRGRWQCQPAGDSLPSGSIVLYTRLKSRQAGSITHHWYQGDTLQRSVRLTFAANWSAGYRTYSRQMVDSGNWRVEVRSAAGELLHERRFAVR